MARRLKPTKMAIVDYAPGGRVTTTHRKFNVQEPEHSESKPVAPENLSAVERRYFDTLVERMAEMGYASASYTELLALAAETRGMILRCREALKKSGLGEKSHASPEVRVMQRAEFQLASYLGALGLTPTTKPKVVAPNAKRKVIELPKNAFSDLIGKRSGERSTRH